MFNIFKKGKEFNNLAKSFNGVYVMIQDIIPKIQRNPSREEFAESIFAMAYIARKGIDDRIETENISMDAKIIVPTINRGFITVAYAYNQTVGKLAGIAEELDLGDEMDEIMSKGNAFRQLEKTLPKEILDNI